MGKLKPSDSSSSSSSSSACLISFLIFSVHLFSILSNAEGFNSLIRLPQYGSSRNRTQSNAFFYVDDYGAKGDGFHDDTKSFQDVWKKACSFSSKYRIVINFPAGSTYLVQPIDFSGPCRSKLTLKMSGVIIAPMEPDAWDGLNPQKWLYFHGVNNLIIEGGGAIDGRGHKWWAQSCKINDTMPCQHAPTVLTFHRCNHLKIRNLVTINSQQMHLAFTYCMHVAVAGLKVIAPGSSPNTDGIHISSSTYVQVKDSIIKTGDDCISIVGNSSSIGIRNIVCGPGHGISIGSLGKSESLVQVHNVIVDGAYLSNTENGVRIKTWQGGSGFTNKIAFKNVFMENVSNPIIIDQYYCDSRAPCLNQTLAVKVEDVAFTTIRGTSATEEGIIFVCSDSSPCEHLYLEDIQLVRYHGGPIRSFCWQAQGWSSSLVHPPPCFSSGESFISLKIPLTTTLQST